MNQQNKNGANMKNDHWIITQEGLHFINDMTALAMHELKNKLAIINENSGLIQDLFFMAKQGRELNIERIEAISHKIQKQVKLSDAIIKKVNHFSQSLDLNQQDADLEQVMNSVVSLADRLIEKRGYSIQIISPAEPIIINENLFILKNLLWKVIDLLSFPGDQGSALEISFKEERQGPLIFFKTGSQADSLYNNILESHEINAMVRHLNVEFKPLSDQAGIGLFWPDDIKKN